MDPQAQTGFILWITGMTGAGKTSLARFLHQRLSQIGRPVEFIDADDRGELLTAGLGPSKDDRDLAVKRVGQVAKMLSRHGVIAVCAALSPYREPREALRREARRFVEVFVDCPMDVLLGRDPTYRKAMAGEVKNVPGVDDPYEPPTHADVTVHSDQERTEEAALRLFQALVDLKYLAPAEFGRLTGGQRPKRARPAKHGKRARKPRGREEPAARPGARPASKKAAARAPAPRRVRKR